MFREVDTAVQAINLRAKAVHVMGLSACRALVSRVSSCEPNNSTPRFPACHPPHTRALVDAFVVLTHARTCAMPGPQAPDVQQHGCVGANYTTQSSEGHKSTATPQVQKPRRPRSDAVRILRVAGGCNVIGARLRSALAPSSSCALRWLPAWWKVAACMGVEAVQGVRCCQRHCNLYNNGSATSNTRGGTLRLRQRDGRNGVLSRQRTHPLISAVAPLPRALRACAPGSCPFMSPSRSPSGAAAKK